MWRRYVIIPEAKAIYGRDGLALRFAGGKVGKLHGVEAWVLASSVSRRHLVSTAPSAKNQALKMLPKGGTTSSGKQFCGILFGVKVFTFMAVLLGHDESGPMLGVKLLLGPRWRGFHCLAASRGVSSSSYGL